MRVGGVKLDFLRKCVGIIKCTGVCLYRHNHTYSRRATEFLVYLLITVIIFTIRYNHGAFMTLEKDMSSAEKLKVYTASCTQIHEAVTNIVHDLICQLFK